MNNDLISRSELKMNEPHYDEEGCRIFYESEIDNAPTVPLPDFKEGYKQAIIDGKTNFSRPQGEWMLGERNGEGYDYYCSRCMHITNENINEIRFCPKCGADMRKGEVKNDNTKT